MPTLNPKQRARKIKVLREARAAARAGNHTLRRWRPDVALLKKTRAAFPHTKGLWRSMAHCGMCLEVVRAGTRIPGSLEYTSIGRCKRYDDLFGRKTS